jgi:uncharacterized membrane protein YhhN
MGLLLLALLFAVLNSVGFWFGWKWLQVIAKPAVMVVLFIHLWTSVGLSGAAIWFGVGILFCLAGDVFMLGIDRFFIPGLAAFLVGHIAYIIGFNMPPSPLSLWGLILAVLVGLSGARIIRRLLAAMVEKSQVRMRLPVALYGMVLSLMMLSAMLKLTDSTWDATASALAGLGAFLFTASDVILAWNKFVSPINNGRLINIAVYHLGQILLVAGVVLQLK